MSTVFYVILVLVFKNLNTNTKTTLFYNEEPKPEYAP